MKAQELPTKFPEKPRERRVHVSEEVASPEKKQELFSKAEKFYSVIKSHQSSLIINDSLHGLLIMKVALKVQPKQGKELKEEGCFCYLSIRCGDNMWSYEIYDISYRFRSGMQLMYSGFDDSAKAQADEEVSRLQKKIIHVMGKK
jgi:hypothetical protein